MAQIIDVSPTRSNTNASGVGHSVTGRMNAGAELKKSCIDSGVAKCAS